jgi:hypothetical protein
VDCDRVRGPIFDRQQVFPISKFALRPMLSAIWKSEMTHRSTCLPDFPERQLAIMEIKTVIAMLWSRSKFQTNCAFSDQ